MKCGGQVARKKWKSSEGSTISLFAPKYEARLSLIRAGAEKAAGNRGALIS